MHIYILYSYVSVYVYDILVDLSTCTIIGFRKQMTSLFTGPHLAHLGYRPVDRGLTIPATAARRSS